MAAMSNYLESALLNHVFRTTDFVQPATLAVALCTSSPTAADTGATIPEVVGGNYARMSIARNDVNWTLTTNEVCNTAIILFPQASAVWGQITHVAILDNATLGAGNLLFFGGLSVQKTVGDGDIFEFDIKQLKVQLN